MILVNDEKASSLPNLFDQQHLHMKDALLLNRTSYQPTNLLPTNYIKE